MDTNLFRKVGTFLMFSPEWTKLLICPKNLEEQGKGPKAHCEQWKCPQPEYHSWFYPEGAQTLQQVAVTQTKGSVNDT